MAKMEATNHNLESKIQSFWTNQAKSSLSSRYGRRQYRKSKCMLMTMSSTTAGLTFVSTAFQFQLEVTVLRLLSCSSTRRSRPPTIASLQQKTVTLRMFLRRETRTPHSKHTALHLHRPHRLNNSSRLL